MQLPRRFAINTHQRLLVLVAVLAAVTLACSLTGEEATPTAAVSSPTAGSQSGVTLAAAAEIEDYYAGSSIFFLEEFADETYSQDEYNTPGTLVFTVPDPGPRPVAVESSWCADSLDLALDDWQYMQTTFQIDGELVGQEHIYFDQWETEDGDGCVSDSILINAWEPGSYTILLTIDQSVDLGDVPAGEYIWDYRVTVP